MTNTAKHTPGAWTLAEEQEGAFKAKVYGGDGYLVAACGTKRPDEEDFANARLIAAAPELLEALKNLMEIWECNSDHYEEEIALYAPLIAKAEGK